VIWAAVVLLAALVLAAAVALGISLVANSRPQPSLSGGGSCALRSPVRRWSVSGYSPWASWHSYEHIMTG